jgi:N-acetylglutamate synthase-like GNAT family acetyltransferase
VYRRNGNKKVDEDGIRAKWNTINRNVDFFREQGFISIKINTAKVKKKDMLLAFLNTCDKYREGKL